ncbi:MAG: toll/interleukin-1 receptor domain-containing protein [Myxococcales bacterium]|nr:toll/interleukin-1 receptor domain-containing protein [Myxococcales bacterium]
MTRGRIFLSYRHNDVPGQAGRIYDRLHAVFPGRVFRDIEGLAPGVDFVEELDRRVSMCKAIVAVIGPGWAGASDDGSARIREDADWVRLEVSSALKRKVTVIPVLVGGASMPSEDQLPSDLQGLARRQAVTLTEQTFDHGMEKIIAAVGKAAGSPVRRPRTTPRRRGIGWVTWMAVLTTALVLVCGGVAVGLGGGALMIAALSQGTSLTDTGLPTPASVASMAPVASGGATGFSPVGSWSMQDSAGNQLQLELASDQTFAVTGLWGALPVSNGSWTFDEGEALLLTGTNLWGLSFTTTVQITRKHDEHWHANSSEWGETELWPR